MDSALGQARRRHLVLAEGAGRRGGPRHAGALAAGGGAPRELPPALALAEDLSPDQGRQAERSPSFRGATINTPSMLAVEDALRQRSPGPRPWAACRPSSPRVRGQPDRGGRLGRRQRLGRLPGRGSGDPLADQHLPQDRRPLVPGPRIRRAGGRGESTNRPSGRGGGGLRSRCLPRRAAGPTPVGRRDGRAKEDLAALLPWLDWAYGRVARTAEGRG